MARYRWAKLCLISTFRIQRGIMEYESGHRRFPLTFQWFRRQFRRSLSIKFSLDDIASPDVKLYVKTNAASLGCSDKSLFFHLLSCCAACMGSEASLEITSDWKEAPILWTLIITPTIVNRLNIIDILKHHMLDAWSELQNHLITKHQNSSESNSIPQFIFEFFDLKGLHEILLENNGHAFGMYSNVDILQKHVNSMTEREVLEKLHYSSSWIANKKTFHGTVKRTCVNITAQSSLENFHTLFYSENSFAEFLRSCFVVLCSEEKCDNFSTLASGIPCKDLKQLFLNILSLHYSAKITYKLSPPAYDVVRQVQNEMMKARPPQNAVTKRSFYYVSTLLVRLACISHVLDNTVEALSWNLSVDPFTWSNEISVQAVMRAKEILGIILHNHDILNEKHDESTRGSVRENTFVDFTGTSREQPNVMPFLHSVFPLQSSNMNPPLVTHASNYGNSQKLSPNMTVPNTLPINEKISRQTHENTVSPSLLSLDSSVSQPICKKAALDSVYTEEDLNNFVNQHKIGIKRLLECSIIEMTPTVASQMKLFGDPLSPNESQQKYSSSFARYCFSKLVAMGVGTFTEHNKFNHKYCFVKKPYNELNMEQLNLLSSLAVTQQEYEKGFTSTDKTNDNTRQTQSDVEEVVISD